MRLIFKILSISIIFQGMVFSIGTQFLAIPRNNFELIGGYNPVCFEYPNNPVISVTYGKWLADMNLTDVSFSNSFKKGWAGLELRYLALNDLELRTERPTDDPIAYYSTMAYAFDAWYAQEYKFATLAIKARFLSIQLYDESAEGFAIDLNLSKKFSEKLSAGMAILNLGNMSTLYIEQPKLPLRTILGTEVTVNLLKINNNIAVSLEKSSIVEGMIFHISDRIKYNNLQFLLGSEFATQNISLSSGVNITLGNYQIGYTVRVGSQALGTPQYLNFSILLP